MVWSIMEDYLSLIGLGYRLQIHAFVMMSNHYHLLLTAPEGNLSKALNIFQSGTAREVNRLCGRTNQLWGTRNHKSLINSYHYFMNAYKYVHRNPVRAGIVPLVEAYPFSTLSGLCGLSKLIVPVAEDTILFNPTFDQTALDWLNRPSKPEHEAEVRIALRRSRFEFKTSRTTGRPSELETLLI